MIDPSQLGLFIDDLEAYIRALIIDTNSDHVEDAVRLTELRQDLIDNLLNGKYRDD